jgi:hypothetical protein
LRRRGHLPKLPTVIQRRYSIHNGPRLRLRNIVSHANYRRHNSAANYCNNCPHCTLSKAFRGIIS